MSRDRRAPESLAGWPSGPGGIEGGLEALERRLLLAVMDFAAPVSYAAGVDPRDVILVDLDGDLDEDMVVVNAATVAPDPHKLTIRLNNGMGSFGAAQDVVVGRVPFQAAAGDFDNDGNNDLAVVNSNTDNDVSVLLNTGVVAGVVTFARTDYATGVGPMAISAGDLDGDTDLDLAIGNTTPDPGTVWILWNAGTHSGTFGGVATELTVGKNPFSIVIADLDNVNGNDLAVANSDTGSISIWLNEGAGTFTADPDVGTGALPFELASDDLDGDGDVDLVVVNALASPRSAWVLQNNTVEGPDPDRFTHAGTLLTGDVPMSVDTGDLDGDGDADVVVGNELSDTVSIFENISGSTG